MIDIILATYNGEKYLSEQIDSIVSQTYCEWRLLIHDDGSLDQTIDIIKEYQRNYPAKILFVDDGINGLGVKDNFAHLMTLATSDYIMFCDQDDIWFNDKIEKSLDLMNRIESSVGTSVPIGVFSDLKVVGKELIPIAESMWAFISVSPKLVESIKYLAIRNCIIGCTMMINKYALRLSLPIPKEAVMHDWWVGLVILKNNGYLLPMTQPTALYRQHGLNVVGASEFSIIKSVQKSLKFSKFFEKQEHIFRMSKNIGAIRNRPLFALIKFYVLINIFLKRW
jgi:glycosyltransferase involved in cell wall biosynthesis